MTELLVLAAANAGLAVGWLLTKNASAESLYQAHARGLWEGRSCREWEVNSLQLRIRKLEADVRRYGNGIGA